MEEHKIGDKVKIKAGSQAGQRALIVAIHADGTAVVRVDKSQIDLQPSDFTNYSLAARRAWMVMPKRSGRPAATKKKPVSIRISVEAWEALGIAVDKGLIQSRESAINEWVSRGLSELFEKTNPK